MDSSTVERPRRLRRWSGSFRSPRTTRWRARVRIALRARPLRSARTRHATRPLGDELLHANGVVSTLGRDPSFARCYHNTPKAIRVQVARRARAASVDPAEQRTDDSGSPFLRIVVAVMLAVVLVAAGVSLWAANQVVRPINDIVEDIRYISKGRSQAPHTRAWWRRDRVAGAFD